jgi:hypothetical protein
MTAFQYMQLRKGRSVEARLVSFRIGIIEVFVNIKVIIEIDLKGPIVWEVSNAIQRHGQMQPRIARAAVCLFVFERDWAMPNLAVK